MTSNAILIKINVTPEDVSKALPNQDEDPGNGFSDLSLAIQTENEKMVTYEISYDGESELLARVVLKPEEMSDSECEVILIKHFRAEPEEEDEAEEEEVPA